MNTAKNSNGAEAKSNNLFLKLVALLCVAVLACGMVGCMSPQNATNQQEEENKPLTSSQYMAEVNQKVEVLSERLAAFNEAVSRQDPITMRTQADNAFAVLDEIAAIEQPEELNDLKAEYVKGSDQLKDALNGYVTLYTEIANATDDQPFDYSTYPDRIQQIQEQYDEGIKTLEAADKTATEL